LGVSVDNCEISVADESQVRENLVTNRKPGPLFRVYTTDGHLILNSLTMVIFALANCFWIYKQLQEAQVRRKMVG
jgi:hypothetical protein